MNWRDLVPLFLFLHVLAAIVAIGPNFAYSTIRGMGRQEPQHANFGLRATHRVSARLVYPIGLVIPVTGVLMIILLGLDLTSRSLWWLDVAIAIYAAVYLYSFFVQRRVIDRIIELTSSPPPAEGPPPELPALAARAQRGGTAMLILLAAVALLMVVKPQI